MSERGVYKRTKLTTDERAVPPQGRIGETEDLIGSVFVEDGKVSNGWLPYDDWRRQGCAYVLDLAVCAAASASSEG